MKKVILMIIFLALIATGCNKKNFPIEEEEIIPPVTEETTIDEVETLKVEKEGSPSPLSGIYGPDDIINRRIVAVMFDNHPSARWQSGLKDAEVIYEYPVEAPYTRYIGLYLLNNPDSIGPIRSSRPYFVTKVLEFDAIYVRVGGSEQAKKDIKALSIADIDGLTSSNKVFWRKSNKKMPHNLYTSMDIIRETQEERKYKNTGDFEGFKFNEEDVDKQGFQAKSILINYMSNNTTKYIYDESNKFYLREKDGKKHIDEIDQSPIIAKNIIIQEAKVKVLDKEGRLSIDLIGEGNGKYFTNGVGMDIRWVKDSRDSKTYYYDENGEEISLNPGVTWVQVVNLDPSIEIE